MRRRHVAGAIVAGLALTVTVCAYGLTPAAASTPLPSVVSATPVSWTPNVSADSTVGQEGSGAACNSTFFGSGNLSCQSEVYSTAYVNGEVVVAGAFTEACQPGTLAEGLCAPGTQVTRDDIFAYQAGTGIIDPNFDPVLNAGPAWAVTAGPPGSNTVYVGGAFTTVDGASHKGLVQLNVNPGVTTGATADGSVVTGFKASVSNYVRDLVLSPDGTALYVGGQFTSVDSVSTFSDGDAVAGLARLNASTGALDQSFTFTLGDPVSGLPVKVEAMALSPNGDELAVSGTALQVNGQDRPRLAVINTGGTLGATAALSDFYAPILNNDCSAEHDYVRGLDFSPDGTFIVTADTGYLSDGSTPYSTCDAVARYDINAADTTTTGTPVDVAPAWIDYGGGDSFYSVAIAGNVVYAGGHSRWVNNYCGNNAACEPNALMENGIAALDANTGMGLPWWHPQTLRGDGTMYLSTFPAGTYDGSKAGLALGTDVDVIGGAYHSENALFPLAATTSASAGGPVPSGMFNEEGGSNTGTPMCLDDPGDSSATGTAAEISTCLNDAEQNWTVPSPGAAGKVKINGLCLDSTGGGAGTPVELNTCSGSANQQWQQEAGNTLVNPASGLCLDDPGDSTSNGTQLDVATCAAGDTGQVWPLPAAQAPPAPPATGPVWMTSEEQSDTQIPCLDDASNSTATGNKVQIWTCRGDTEQNWTAQANGTITIDGNYCLDTSGGAAAAGTPVVLDPCSGAATQTWAPGSDNELVNQGATTANGTPYCLADPGSATGDGTQMEIAACDGGSNQAWRLPAV
jgi:Ricin-type beta-trefoil lectin domain